MKPKLIASKIYSTACVIHSFLSIGWQEYSEGTGRSKVALGKHCSPIYLPLLWRSDYTPPPSSNPFMSLIILPSSPPPRTAYKLPHLVELKVKVISIQVLDT